MERGIAWVLSAVRMLGGPEGLRVVVLSEGDPPATRLGRTDPDRELVLVVHPWDLEKEERALATIAHELEHGERRWSGDPVDWLRLRLPKYLRPALDQLVRSPDGRGVLAELVDLFNQRRLRAEVEADLAGVRRLARVGLGREAMIEVLTWEIRKCDVIAHWLTRCLARQRLRRQRRLFLRCT